MISFLLWVFSNWFSVVRFLVAEFCQVRKSGYRSVILRLILFHFLNHLNVLITSILKVSIQYRSLLKSSCWTERVVPKWGIKIEKNGVYNTLIGTLYDILKALSISKSLRKLLLLYKAYKKNKFTCQAVNSSVRISFEQWIIHSNVLTLSCCN